MGWSEIDKLAAIDEREEELKERDGKDRATRQDIPPRR